METSILEKKLVEIEKKKPFQNDDDMIQAIEMILSTEYKKKDAKQNDQLISECLDTLLMLKGCDVEELNKKLKSESEKTLARLHEKIEQIQAKKEPISSFRNRKLIFAVACIIFIFAILNIVAYANEYDIWNSLKVKIEAIFDLSSDEKITVGNVEIARGGELINYHSIDTLVRDIDISIIYPDYLPLDITLENISAVNNSAIESKYDIFFEFSSDHISYTAHTYNFNNFTQVKESTTTYETKEAIFYIFKEDMYYTAYFEHNEIQYILRHIDYDELIKILDDLKGW